MPRYLARTPRHHTCNASTQKSLVSPEPKTSVNAPVNNTRSPKGTSFSLAGGSWSQPFSTSPSPSVRVFPPPHVIPHRHLGLRVHRDFQRLRVVPHLLPDCLDVGEDGVGLLGLLQRLALLNALEAIIQAVEDVAHRPLAGQVLLPIAFGGQQGRSYLGSRQVAVAACGSQLGIGVGLGLYDGPDVSRQLRVLVFAALAAAGGEV